MYRTSASRSVRRPGTCRLPGPARYHGSNSSSSSSRYSLRGAPSGTAHSLPPRFRPSLHRTQVTARPRFGPRWRRSTAPSRPVRRASSVFLAVIAKVFLLLLLSGRSRQSCTAAVLPDPRCDGGIPRCWGRARGLAPGVVSSSRRPVLVGETQRTVDCGHGRDCSGAGGGKKTLLVSYWVNIMVVVVECLAVRKESTRFIGGCAAFTLRERSNHVPSGAASWHRLVCRLATICVPDFTEDRALDDQDRRSVVLCLVWAACDVPVLYRTA